jgi:hypothetical protein
MRSIANPKLLKKIDSLDLHEVLFYLTDYGGGPRWNRATASAIDVVYRQFVYILVVSEEFRPVPSDYIDHFWHAHILMTKKYAEDCISICGRVLHHDPLFGTRDDEERYFYNRCKAMTINAFESIFGTTTAMMAGRT